MILQYPDERLSQPCPDVEQFDERLRAQAKNLIEALGTAKGLSSPQIGDPVRMLVLARDEGPELFINPFVRSKAGFGLVEESCLSVPGVVVNVFRATKLEVVAQDLDGERFVRELQDIEAVCLQHEVDHLDGILLTDHMFFWNRWRYRRRVQATAAA
ncbi:MAG: peptide deformylase [Myxococcota bacterium]